MNLISVEIPRVAVLGITGDPVTSAHVGLAAAALRVVDQVWIVPAGNHVEKPGITSFDHRFRMTQLAVEEMGDKDGRIIASRVEGERPGVSYTIDTLDLVEQTTGNPTVLLLGSDRVSTLHTWKEHAMILNRHGVLVVQRPFNQVRQEELLPGMELLKSDQIDGCSGNARRAAAEGNLQELEYIVGSSVAHYIMDNGLYAQS